MPVPHRKPIKSGLLRRKTWEIRYILKSDSGIASRQHIVILVDLPYELFSIKIFDYITATNNYLKFFYLPKQLMHFMFSG